MDAAWTPPPNRRSVATFVTAQTSLCLSTHWPTAIAAGSSGAVRPRAPNVRTPALSIA